jgi:putative transposase
MRHPRLDLLALPAELLFAALFKPEWARDDQRRWLGEGSFPPEEEPFSGETPTVPPRRLTRPQETSCYLVTSRICSNSPFFGEEEFAVFRAQLEKTAAFCGVTVLNYTVLPDHFHLLLEVPELQTREMLREEVVLDRVETLYGCRFAELLREALGQAGEASARGHFGSRWLRRGVPLESAGELAGAWARRELERLRGMMHDLAMFMKLCKQRFSLWYNSNRSRYGTLWGDAFRSLLVERTAESIALASAFVDLNAVRQGLVENPADYPYCGLAEATKAPGMARDGIQRTMAMPGNPEASGSWAVVGERYRALLWGNEIAEADGASVAGQPRLADYFLFTHRLFRRGVALGSHRFVRKLVLENRAYFGGKQAMRAPHRLRISPSLPEFVRWDLAGVWVLGRGGFA